METETSILLHRHFRESQTFSEGRDSELLATGVGAGHNKSHRLRIPQIMV